MNRKERRYKDKLRRKEQEKFHRSHVNNPSPDESHLKS